MPTAAQAYNLISEEKVTEEALALSIYKEDLKILSSTVKSQQRF